MDKWINFSLFVCRILNNDPQEVGLLLSYTDRLLVFKKVAFARSKRVEIKSTEWVNCGSVHQFKALNGIWVILALYKLTSITEENPKIAIY